ncbi:MAG: DUF58 domain-containing protein [Planctomycetes bacterium]|nr:DUF58 domain-containing protein [Planctomycetota bacterium]
MNNKDAKQSFSITGVKLRKNDWNRFRLIIAGTLFGFLTTTSAVIHIYYGLEILIILLYVSIISFVWLLVEWLNRKGDNDFFDIEQKKRNIKQREGLWRGLFWLLVPVSIISLNWWQESKNNMLAMLVFSISALSLILCWIFLFKQRKRSKFLWIEPKVGNITKFGFLHSTMTILLGIIAMQTGLNLVYGLFAVLFSLIIVSMFLSRMNFIKLEVTRKIPSELFALTPTEITSVIKNKKRLISVFSIWMEEAWPPELEYPEKLPSAYALQIGSGESKHLNYEITFPRRGVFNFMGFTFATRFPFSMFTYYHYLKQDQNVVIYPRLVKLPKMLTILDNNIRHHSNQFTMRQNRDTGDFRSLREYIQGVDDVRRIHWKTTARQQKPILREFELAKENSHLIVFEIANNGQLFERGIELATSLINEAYKNSIGFILVIPAKEILIALKSSRSERNKAFDILAKLQGFENEKDFEKYREEIDENMLEISDFANPVSNVIILSVDSSECFQQWCSRNLEYFNRKLKYEIARETQH